MFSGLYTALITPFKSDGLEIDFDEYANFLKWQLSVGINGVVALGTTAESAVLSHEEKIKIVKITVDVVNKKVPIIVGTGTNCTKTTVEFTQEVSKLGVDAALVVTPYYNKPTQAGLLAHFRAVADQGGLPVILYNIPGRTGTLIETNTLSELAHHEKIVGVKQAVDSASQLLEISSLISDKFAIYAGDDALTYFVMSIGGSGVISASANAIPERMLAIVQNALGGDMKASYQEQIRALPYINSLFKETNPAPVKAALKFMGKIKNDALRLPLVSVKSETRAIIEDVFKEK